jgi:hypothetical protein
MNISLFFKKFTKSQATRFLTIVHVPKVQRLSFIQSYINPLFQYLYLVSFVILYSDQQMHNYHTATHRPAQQ